MDKSTTIEQPKEELNHAKPPVVQQVETYLQAANRWRAGEQNRADKLTLAQKLKDPTEIAKYTTPIPKDEDTKHWDALWDITVTTDRLCDKQYSDPKAKVEFDQTITDLLTNKSDELTPEKFVKITSIIHNQGGGNRSFQVVGDLMEAYPQTLHSEAAKGVVKAIQDKLTIYTDLSKFAQAKSTEKDNVDKVIEAVITPESPFEDKTKQELKDTRSEITGYRLRSYVDAVTEQREASRQATILKPEEIVDRLGKSIPLEIADLQKAIGNGPYLDRDNLGRVLARAANQSTNPETKRGLQMTALGFIEATIDSRPVFGYQEHGDTRAAKEARYKQLDQSAIAAFIEMIDPEIGVTNFVQSNDDTDQPFKKEFKRIFAKARLNDYRNAIGVQHQDILNKRAQIEDEARIKRKAVEAEEKRQKAEAEAAIEARRLEEQQTRDRKIAELIQSDELINSSLNTLADPNTSPQTREAAKTQLMKNYETNSDPDLKEASRLASVIATQIEQKQKFSSPRDESVGGFVAKKGLLGLGGTTYFPSDEMLAKAHDEFARATDNLNSAKMHPDSVTSYEVARLYNYWLGSVSWKKESSSYIAKAKK